MRLLIAFGLLLAACDGRPPPGPDGGGGRPLLELGERCTDASECTSGVCVGMGRGEGVCSRVCASERDCPEGDNWGCVHPAERPELSVCGCQPDADEERCADGRDNDCDGRLDDCLTCGGRVIAGDDDEHCGACFVTCAADEECRGGECRCADRAEVLCEGRCVDLSADVGHCGACGNSCRAGDVCTDGVCSCPPGRAGRCEDGCFDLSSDPTHCGSCTTACEAGLECIDGACACPAERPDRCGSECVDTSSDGRHCGGCGNACASGLVCRSGECECTATTESDFCEGVGCVDFDTDPAHCGGCGNACASGLVCRAGVCACPTSGAPDYCPGVGCVSLSNTAAHCGGCGDACPPSLGCRGGVCACPDTADLYCGGECVDPQWDARHCGGCGIACRAGERCDRGACMCPSGLVCGGVCVSSGPTNCGGCGVTCGPGQYCSSGRCICPSVSETFCGDGCYDLRYDEASCGSCGSACGTGQTCTSGTCTCPGGQTWCAALGRCANLSTDAANCGTCGNACRSGEVCSSGTCRCAVTGQTYCASAGTCVDTRTDVAHCGACDNACPAGTTCSFGTCRCPLSSQRFCASTGACTDVTANDAHCGSCDNACPSGSSCSSSRCVCPISGETACSTGCTNLASDEANCGTCGRACASTQECRGGSCECPAPMMGAPHRVTNGVGDSVDVQLALGDTHVGVIYLDSRAGRRNAYFARSDLDGAPTGADLALTAFTTSSYEVDDVALAWTGAGWVAVWQERSTSGYRLGMQAIDSSGTATGAPTFVPVITPAGTGTQYFDMRAAHTSALGVVIVVTEGFSGLSGVRANVLFRVLGDGGAPGSPISLFSSNAGGVDISQGPGGTSAVVYATFGGDVYFQRVEADGSIVSAPELALSRMGGSQHGTEPSIDFDGTSFALSWIHRDSATSTSRQMLEIAGGPPAFSRSTVTTVTLAGWTERRLRRPEVSIRSGTAFLVWQRLSGTASVLDARRYSVSSSGAPTPLESITPVLSLATVADFPLGVAWTDATRAVVAWSDTRWGATEVYDQGLVFPMCSP